MTLNQIMPALHVPRVHFGLTVFFVILPVSVILSALSAVVLRRSGSSSSGWLACIFLILLIFALIAGIASRTGTRKLLAAMRQERRPALACLCALARLSRIRFFGIQLGIACCAAGLGMALVAVLPGLWQLSPLLGAIMSIVFLGVLGCASVAPGPNVLAERVVRFPAWGEMAVLMSTGERLLAGWSHRHRVVLALRQAADQRAAQSVLGILERPQSPRPEIAEMHPTWSEEAALRGAGAPVLLGAAAVAALLAFALDWVLPLHLLPTLPPFADLLPDTPENTASEQDKQGDTEGEAKEDTDRSGNADNDLGADAPQNAGSGPGSSEGSEDAAAEDGADKGAGGAGSAGQSGSDGSAGEAHGDGASGAGDTGTGGSPSDSASAQQGSEGQTGGETGEGGRNQEATSEGNGGTSASQGDGVKSGRGDGPSSDTEAGAQGESGDGPGASGAGMGPSDPAGDSEQQVSVAEGQQEVDLASEGPSDGASAGREPGEGRGQTESASASNDVADAAGEAMMANPADKNAEIIDAPANPQNGESVGRTVATTADPLADGEATSGETMILEQAQPIPADPVATEDAGDEDDALVPSPGQDREERRALAPGQSQDAAGTEQLELPASGHIAGLMAEEGFAPEAIELRSLDQAALPAGLPPPRVPRQRVPAWIEELRWQNGR